MTAQSGTIKKYNFFVIGAGSGGVRAARIAAGHGAKVGIAEAKHLGGTCVNAGCIPKKLLAYGSDFHMHFDDAAAYGWTVGKTSFDWQKLITNKNNEIKRLNGIYDKLLTDSGAEIINGHARFIDPHTLDIDGQTVKADKILIATGGRPHIPDIKGKEHVITSDDAFYLPQFPQNVVIVGGGFIGVEFAHILHGMGANVTLLHRGDLFLRGFDKDLRETLADEMTKQGIKLCFNTELQEAVKKGKSYEAITNNGTVINTDLIMAAIGRDAQTDDLGLDTVGIKTVKNGQIKVNERFETAVPHIYAIGDIANRHNLTPVALAEGHALADNLFGPGAKHRTVSYKNIPAAVFSHPPIATVGLSEEDALAEGYDITIYQSKFRPLKHTLTGRDEKSLMKLVVDNKTDQVIGCHMIGADAPEIMQGFAVAVQAGATKADFDRTIGIHPTAAEEFVTMRTPRSP